MLLQIAEPGQSAKPHQHKLAVGIDLGTTYSSIAYVDELGNAQVVVSDSGFITPFHSPTIGLILGSSGRPA